MSCFKLFIFSCSVAICFVAVSLSISSAAIIPLSSSTPALLVDPPSAASLQFTTFGFRFELSEAFTVTEVGGHFQNTTGIDQDVFAVIVKLDDANDFPATSPAPGFDLAKVVASTTITVPGIINVINRPIVSEDIFLPSPAPPFSPVVIGPGNYALVFGTGDFGVSAANVGAVRDHQDINSPDYIESNAFVNGGPWAGSNADGFHFFLVPEPSSIILLLLSSMCLGFGYYQKRKST